MISLACTSVVTRATTHFLCNDVKSDRIFLINPCKSSRFVWYQGCMPSSRIAFSVPLAHIIWTTVATT